MNCWVMLRQSGKHFTTVAQFYTSSRSTGCTMWFSAKWIAISVSYQVQMTATMHFSETCLTETDNTKIAQFIWMAECEMFNIAYLNFRPIKPLFYMSIIILQPPSQLSSFTHGHLQKQSSCFQNRSNMNKITSNICWLLPTWYIIAIILQ